MTWSECKDIVEKSKKYDPPVVCTYSFCGTIQSKLDRYCHDTSKTALTPVPEFDPNLYGPNKGDWCFCCCSCLAYDTPVEVAPGEFDVVQNINRGSTVMAAGLSRDWKPAEVTFTGGWESAKQPVTNNYLVQYAYPEDGGGHREIIVTADHLFVVEDSTLKPVQELQTGDLLMRADGGTAEVRLVLPGWNVRGIRSVQLGTFDGTNLDGHLMNVNGVMTADYAVQVYFASHHLPEGLLHAQSVAGTAPRVGTPEYVERNHTQAHEAFLNDHTRWPQGFTPMRTREINVPIEAHRYFTDREARRIMARRPPAEGYANVAPAQTILYLFNIARPYAPNTVFLLDWMNHTPNAYTWTEWNQRIVVVTGGLVRLQCMGRDGLSIVLASMLAYARGWDCVGEADYDGVYFVLREMWENELYRNTFKNGYAEIVTLFGYAAPGEGEGPGDPGDPGDPSDPSDPGDPIGRRRDRCKNPGLDCRLEAYRNAVSMMGVPECAVPVREGFAVRSAVLDASGIVVTVKYSRPVDPPTAQTLENYAIAPEGATLLGVRYDARHPNEVYLAVTGLQTGTSYTLSVTGVVDESVQPLEPATQSVAISGTAVLR